MSYTLQASQIPKNQFLEAKFYLKQGHLFCSFIGDNSKFDFFEKLHLYNIALRLNPLCYQAYIQKGILLKKNNKIDEAIQMFDKAEQLKTQEKQIYKNKGNIYMDLSNFDKALEFYEIAMKLDNQDEEIYLQKGKIYFTQNKIEESIQMFEEAMKYSPQSYEYQKLGNKFFDEKKYKEALILSDMLIQLDPKKGYLEKGKKLIALGEIKDAFLMLNEALKFDPFSDEYLIIGDKFFDEKRYYEALIIYEMLIMLNTNQGSQRKVRTLITLGKMEEAFQQFNEAMKQNEKYWKYQERGQIFSLINQEIKFFKIMNIKNQSIRCRQILEQYKASYQKTLVASSKMQEAFQIFKEQIRYDPYHWEYQEIGDQFLAEQKYEEAFVMYDACIRKKNSRKGYLGKGKLFVALEKQNRNIDKFLKDIQYVPSFQNYQQIGDQFFDDHQYEDAFILYDMLIKLDPRKGQFIKGFKLITLGKTKEAKLIFDSIESDSSQDFNYLSQYSKLGDQLFDQKQYEKSFHIYDIMIQFQPRQGYLQKGKKLFAIGQNEEAFSLLNEGIKYDPSFYEYKEIGDQFYNKIKYDEALIMYDMLIKLNPQYGYLVKGKLLIQLGRMQEAFQLLNQAIKYAPSPMEYHKIGDTFFSENKFKEALTIYDMLIKLEPKQGYLTKGKALIQLGHLAKAFQILNEATQYAPSYQDYQKLGNTFFDQEKFEEGFIIYDMLIKLDPKQGYIDKGKKLIAVGKVGKALQILNEATKYNSTSNEYYLIGNQLFDQKKYEESQILYDLSLKLDSKIGYLGKAKALIALGNIDIAFSILNENKQYLSSLRFSKTGDQLFAEKKYEEALVMYHLIQNPQKGYFHKAKTFLAMEKVIEAFKMFNQALQQSPSDNEILFFGDLFFNEKKFEQAFIIYDELIKLNHRDGCFIKGLQLLILGRTEEAQHVYKQYFINCLSQDYIIIGDKLYNDEKYEQALIAYDMSNSDPQEGQLKKIRTLIALGRFEESLQIFDTIRSLDIDTILDSIPNLSYVLYLNRRIQDSQIVQDYLQLEEPWKSHQDLMLQELGEYDGEEYFQFKYCLASQLVKYK